MAATVQLYNKVPLWLVNGSISWAASGGSTIKCMLCTALTITLTDEDVSAMTYTELGAGDGYTAGGVAVTLSDPSASSDTAILDCTDPSWTFTASKTFQYALFYKDDTTDLPIAAVTIDTSSITVPSSTYTLAINADGLIKLDVT